MLPPIRMASPKRYSVKIILPIRILLLLAVSPLLLSAHDLTLERSWTVEGECLFKCTLAGEPAANAKIRISNHDDRLLAQGLLDNHGQFRWKPTIAGDVTVEVDPGLGHRIQRRFSGTSTANASPFAAAPLPDHSEETGHQHAPPATHIEADDHEHADLRPSPAISGFIGATFLLAVGALWVACMNSRRLTELEKHSRGDASRS